MGEDGQDFTAFVKARRAGLVRLCWALTGDRQLGEGLAQAALERIWRRWARVAAGGDPWPYLQRTAVSLSITWWRRRWRAESAKADLPDLAGGHDEVGSYDLRDALRRWLATLPRRQRAVVILRFVTDLSVEETAERLGCSTGTVKSQTSKALQRLRARAAGLAALQEDRS